MKKIPNLTMDLSHENHNGPAALYSSPFTSSNTPNSASHNHFLHSSSGSAPRKLQQPAEEEWASLKLIIEDLYIREDTTQKDLLRLLGTKYGFKVTPKQLTNRLKTWDFWKNITQRHRNIMQHPTTNGLDNAPTMKVTPAKVRRREKERLRRNGHGSFNDSQVLTTTSPGIDTMVVDDGDDLLKTTAAQSSLSNWEFVSWDSVDVNNSPKLTRLFSQLSLEEIPILELSPSTSPTTSTAIVTQSQYVNCCELDKRFSDETLPSSSSNSHTLKESSPGNRSAWPFKYADVDFPLPYFSRCSSPSPFNEVYIFPTNPISARESRMRKSIATIEELFVCESKLAHLKNTRLFSVSDSRILEITRFLVQSFLSRGFNKRAEYWCKQLLHNIESSQTQDSAETFTDRLNLVEAICCRRRYREALAILNGMEKDLLQLCAPSEESLLRFLLLKGEILWYLGDHGNEEAQLRTALQNCLTSFGPNHTKTLEAMFRLAYPLQATGRTEQSEKLLRIAVQVEQKNSLTIYRLIPKLAKLRYEQGHHEESILLCRKSLERAKVQGGTGESAMIRMEIRASLNCITNALLTQRNIRKIIEVFEEYMEWHDHDHSDTSVLVQILASLGETCSTFQEEHEVRQLVSFVKRFENEYLYRLENTLEACRRHIKWLQENSDVPSFLDRNLWYINYLEEWYQEQKDKEEVQVSEFARELVTGFILDDE
ncbi:hypothetical protein HYFRA_00010015 [Hymenoscyphus fraxineus]|uniref:Clr5 domain-containing protein n=1 Tax=Hymenoscyphus fraxineus TaxID=746836 RepID=A0A9N9PTJ1_9HELO|nr:hypothetical protein HYFRA_00010015 [Hymenoscyphus fraxineus]